MSQINEPIYTLIYNNGPERGFEKYELNKEDFLRETSKLLPKPHKIFLGLGDFLEVGDYNNLMDNIFFKMDGSLLEDMLDKNNRKIAKDGNIPFSFFKLAIYFPDFLLKEVPTSCVSAIGKKSRLFPGAETFTRFIKNYEPTVLTAMPHEIAIEFVKRVGLSEDNLFSTIYNIKNDGFRDLYEGGIQRFVSGNRKSIEIEKYMNDNNLSEKEILYIGRGEAGVKTFSTVNSIAFNPSLSIIPETKITLYGSSLQSLLILFDHSDHLHTHINSKIYEGYIPTLVVLSNEKQKSQELINIELEHLRLQSNLIGQRIESSGASYNSVMREIDIAFGGATFNIGEVRNMIRERMEAYRKSPELLVKKIYDIANERYKNFFREETNF